MSAPGALKLGAVGEQLLHVGAVQAFGKRYSVRFSSGLKLPLGLQARLCDAIQLGVKPTLSGAVVHDLEARLENWRWLP